MAWVHYLILFIFGLGIGSFLNVLIWRYEPEQSVFGVKSLGGRSHCPYCKKKLRWFELIPLVSFFIQRGRCRGCGHKLSWQYPIVELLTGLIFAGVPCFLSHFYRMGSIPLSWGIFSILAGAWVLVFLTWLVISAIDLRHYLIPNELNVLLAVLGAFIVIIKSRMVGEVIPFHNSFLKHYTLIFSPTQDIWANHIIGALAGVLFFFLILAVSRGRAMGWGDVKLALVSGFVVGWPEIALSIIIAFVLGGAWGVILLITKRKTMADKLPFAPFLVLGMAATIFFGYQIIQGYMGMFGI